MKYPKGKPNYAASTAMLVLGALPMLACSQVYHICEAVDLDETIAQEAYEGKKGTNWDKAYRAVTKTLTCNASYSDDKDLEHAFNAMRAALAFSRDHNLSDVVQSLNAPIDAAGHNILQHLVRQGHVESLRHEFVRVQLMPLYAVSGSIDSNEDNLLHLAVKSGDSRTVQEVTHLLDSIVDPQDVLRLYKAKNCKGYTPVEVAQRQGSPEIEHALRYKFSTNFIV